MELNKMKLSQKYAVNAIKCRFILHLTTEPLVKTAHIQTITGDASQQT